MTALPRNHGRRDAPPNTRNSTHTLKTVYTTETIRTVVREWAALRREGGMAGAVAFVSNPLARALDQLLEEYHA